MKEQKNNHEFRGNENRNNNNNYHNRDIAAAKPAAEMEEVVKEKTSTFDKKSFVRGVAAGAVLTFVCNFVGKKIKKALFSEEAAVDTAKEIENTSSTEKTE